MRMIDAEGQEKSSWVGWTLVSELFGVKGGTWLAEDGVQGLRKRRVMHQLCTHSDHYTLCFSVDKGYMLSL